MKEGFRQSMAWLHTWVGLLLGWLLFAIFATGTSAYFQEEITRWMQPEVAHSSATREQMIGNAAGWLGREAPGASEWTIILPNKRSAEVLLYWQNAESAPADARTTAKLDSAGREVAGRETKGGEFLYRFHFDLYYINWFWARLTVGVAAMAMLVAILTGIVTHKKIFADFFLLRLGKGQRSWLDAHNVTGVLALPFHLMITFTGLVTLATMYVPWGIAANYANVDKFFEAVMPYPSPDKPSGTAAPLAPIAPMVAEARALLGRDVGTVRILNPGDATMRVIMASASDGGMSARPMGVTFDGTTGRLVSRQPARGAAATTESTLLGLHMGEYAQPVLRWLYFVSGLAGTAMIATGLVMWTAKRRTKLPDPARPHLGFRLVEKLNIGTIAGFPAGIATYFLSNRLLPLDIAGRAEWEIHSMFILWASAMFFAFIRPARRAWVELLATTAALFALVPVVSWITTGRFLGLSLIEGDWVFVGFETVMFALAAAFGWAAWKALRHQPARHVSRRASLAAQAVAA